MENKYFTPDIEDLHIGYELEVNYNFKLNDIFHKKIIDSFEQLSDIHSRMPGDCVIRVPYLTKEQIESEGWKEEQMYLNGTFVMILGELNKGYELMFAGGKSSIVITRVWTLFDEQVKRDNIFKGNCKCINEFRKIIKLLGI